MYVFKIVGAIIHFIFKALTELETILGGENNICRRYDFMATIKGPL